MARVAKAVTPSEKVKPTKPRKVKAAPAKATPAGSKSTAAAAKGSGSKVSGDKRAAGVKRPAAVKRVAAGKVPAKAAPRPRTVVAKGVAKAVTQASKASKPKSVPPAKSAPAKSAPAKSAPAKGTATKRSAAKSAATVPKKATSAKAVPAKAVPANTGNNEVVSAKTATPVSPTLPSAAKPKVVAPKAPAVKVVKRAPNPYSSDAKFLEDQRTLLGSERAVYQEQATDLKAEADSLAMEREPGDVQFDEESGEGGTVTVDRERDLALSAQASAAVQEIDDALARIATKNYGECERCHQPIPKARLRALPYARLCVACKSGGLSRR